MPCPMIYDMMPILHLFVFMGALLLADNLMCSSCPAEGLPCCNSFLLIVDVLGGYLNCGILSALQDVFFLFVCKLNSVDR